MESAAAAPGYMRFYVFKTKIVIILYINISTLTQVHTTILEWQEEVFYRMSRPSIPNRELDALNVPLHPTFDRWPGKSFSLK